MRSGLPTFDILPAIDLREGRVVRLRAGAFEHETSYSDDPVGLAVDWAIQGARWLHVVDLDGALAGQPVQLNMAAAIASAVGGGVRCELAGGMRNDATVAAALEAGIARVVVGTAALADPALIARLVATHGTARIAVALDVRDGRAVGSAWRPGVMGVPVADAARALADRGVTTFEVTAIERDGLLGGPDRRLLEELLALRCGEIIASGGIATLADLAAVRDLGCSGAIVGRALYERAFSVRDAIALASPRASRFRVNASLLPPAPAARTLAP
jgi:phosphoribosylformimino-5-aminoimidazole carboxamide ribotide isomerase